VLFGVTLFKKCVDQFKAACREKRYTLREFTFSASQVRAIVVK
jgi:V-type H+-transporting ATPase subunit C